MFALLAHKDQQTLDPLNLDQWEFFVLPTTALDKKDPTQKAIGLSALLALNPEEATYGTLAVAVERAGEKVL